MANLNFWIFWWLLCNGGLRSHEERALNKYLIKYFIKFDRV